MQNYKWISNQQLDTLTTPLPHDTRQEMKNALESSAKAMIDGSSAMDLLMEESRGRMYRRDRETQQAARFEIYCRFQSKWQF